MPNIKAFELVDQKFKIAEKKRHAWERKFDSLSKQLSKAKEGPAQKKAFAALEKHAATRKKADADLEKAAIARDKRLKELAKEFK